MMRAQQRVVFHAALVRILLGIFAASGLTIMYPRLADHRPLLAGYVGCTLLMQLLIWKDIGGSTRSFISGIVDLLFLTFLVHKVGSVSTMMVSLYLFAGMMNALVVSYRVAFRLAVLASAMYCAVLTAEQLGWLPYGQCAAPWAAGQPGASETVTAAIIVSSLLLLSTAVVGELVRTLHTREAQLEELSQRDALTQLYNRRHLLARAEAELARVRRGHPLTVVMLDLDGFKKVNDKQGHLRGDAVLQEIAAALASAVRATDVVGRYGGDEFVVLLPDTEGSVALQVADRLTAAVAAAGKESGVTASLGTATAAAGEDVRDLLRRADENAYRAKGSGGNRVVSG